MSGFTLLWSKTLYSSLWVKESKETKLVWFTLLMLKNSEGIIQASLVGLADAAKVTLDECKEAVRVLSSPDEDDTSKVQEGRRILEIPGGWQIVNHDLYRFSTEAKREFWKAQKAEQREKEAHQKKRKPRNKNHKQGASPEEKAYVQKFEDEGEEAADKWLENRQDQKLSKIASQPVVASDSVASDNGTGV